MTVRLPDGTELQLDDDATGADAAAAIGAGLARAARRLRRDPLLGAAREDSAAHVDFGAGRGGGAGVLGMGCVGADAQA